MAPMVADASETKWFVEYGKELGLHTVGVMAEVPSLAVVLVGLGATTLSMTPAALADVRAELAGVTLEQAKA
jgi:phosphotransferase system enzyme I (PtsI)